MSQQTQRRLAAASRRLVAALSLVAVTAFVTNAVVTKAGDEPKKSKHEEEMAEWMMANQKTPMHEKLKMFVGEWDCKCTMYMEGMPPQTSKAESDAHLVYDGRYVRQSYKGSFDAPGPDGKPQKYTFEGYGVIGYDTIKKTFVSNWIDSMSTGIYG
ncbi:MAG: DUF1579 family protein, partial [Phycisphaerales bacterium]|nr:DUF1579 family protein [Phycisphaerales bacterium]